MVYEKKRSGDPDYDDKVPADQHAGGEVVTAGDGREVFVSKSIGPVGPGGEHVNLDEPADAEDNRPAPGGVAKEASAVQVDQTPKPGTEDAAPAAKSTSKTSPK